MGGAAQFMRGNYKSFKVINLTVLEDNAPAYLLGGVDGPGN